MARLRVNNVAQVEAAGHQEDADNGHRQRQLVADHLRGTSQASEQRILAVRRPSGQRYTVDAERGDGEERKDANVQVEGGDAKIDVVTEEMDRLRAERNDSDGGERQCEREQRSQEIDKSIHARGGRIFFEKEF